MRKRMRMELRAQGHHNTGELEKSFVSEVIIEGEVVRVIGKAQGYFEYLNTGTRPEKASFKQFPFLVDFIKSKGKDEKTAKQLAAMTINRWKVEGMSTVASARFSKNGRRRGFIKAVMDEHEKNMDHDVTKEIDKVFNKEFFNKKTEVL